MDTRSADNAAIAVAATTPLPGSPGGPRRRATSNNAGASRDHEAFTVQARAAARGASSNNVDALVPTSQALVAHSHANPPDDGLPPNLPAPPASPTPDSNRILLDRLINVIHGLSAQVESLHAEVAALKVDARHHHDGAHGPPLPSDAPCSRCRQKSKSLARASQAESGGEDALVRKLTMTAAPPAAANEMGGGERQYTKNRHATQTTTAATDENATSDATAETKKTDADHAAAEVADAADAAHGRAKELRKARLQARVAAEATSFVPRPGCLFADELYQICYSSVPPPLARVRQLIANGINLRFQDYQGSCT